MGVVFNELSSEDRQISYTNSRGSRTRCEETWGEGTWRRISGKYYSMLSLCLHLRGCVAPRVVMCTRWMWHRYQSCDLAIVFAWAHDKKSVLFPGTLARPSLFTNALDSRGLFPSFTTLLRMHGCWKEERAIRSCTYSVHEGRRVCDLYMIVYIAIYLRTNCRFIN